MWLLKMGTLKQKSNQPMIMLHVTIYTSGELQL